MEKEEKKVKRERHENVIPDLEYLFTEDGTSGKKKQKFLSKILKLNFWKILLGAILYIIKASPLWIVPIATANIIDLASSPLTNTTWRDLAINAIVIGVLLLQNVPMHSLNAKVNDRIIRNTSAGLKSTVIRKLQSLSITYHKEMESGKIQSKFLKDTDSIENLIGNILRIFIPSIIGVVIASGIAIYKSGWISLFFLVVIPCNVLITLLFRKTIGKRNRQYRKENESVSNQLSTMLEMLSVTKAHGLEDAEIVACTRSIKKLLGSGLKVDKTNAYFGAWVWVVNNFLSAVCLVFCAYLAIIGQITIGDVVLYQSLFASISSSVMTIINIVPQLAVGMEAVSSVSEIMLSTDVESNLGKYKKMNFSGKVDFCDVSYKYPNCQQYVIKDFSLHVKPGECIAVVGASGSGKSTIMNLIIGFLTVTEGVLLLDDKPIGEYNLSDYRHHISVVPQNSILFAGTIRENITYGLERYSQEEFDKAVEMANINEFIKELPNGLDTNIGEHGEKLSGGQKQRITIARALIRNPQILILDEATSALDNISEYHVQKAIETSIKGRTTFIVAHRLSTIRNADRIVVMDSGICVESGTYEELMAKKGKFFELKNLNDLTMKEASKNLDGE